MNELRITTTTTTNKKISSYFIYLYSMIISIKSN